MKVPSAPLLRFARNQKGAGTLPSSVKLYTPKVLAYLNFSLDSNSVLVQGQTPKQVVMEQEHCAFISKAVYSRSAGQSKSKADIITTPFFKIQFV